MGQEQPNERALRAGGGSALGALAAVATGATPIGVALVAGLAGALAWRAGRRR
jgi:hypothetical protein